MEIFAVATLTLGVSILATCVLIYAGVLDRIFS